MRKARLVVAVMVPGLLLGTGGIVALRVESNLKTIAGEVRAEGSVPFESIALCGPGTHSSAATGPGFLPLAPSDSYTTGAVLQGKLYLAGPDGLAFYPQPDAEPKRLRLGTDLPAAQVSRLAVGHLRGEMGDSLIAATEGQGLLIFAPGLGSGVQLLPKDAAARDITVVLPLGSDDLLIATRHAGLLVYDGKELKRFLPAVKETVTALAGNDGDLWIGTQDAGVLHWRAGQFTRFDENSGLPDPRVNDIAFGEQGVFVGTPLGVAHFVGGQPAPVLGKGVFARALAIEGDTLLAGTVDQGVRELPLAGRVAHAAFERSDLQVRHFFRSEDRLFAVTDGGAVLKREHGGVWERVIALAAQTLADRNVTSLAFAPDGRLWIGYFDRGADVVDLTAGRAEHFEDDHVFCVNRIVPDPQRLTMDVATANGLVLFDGTTTLPRIRQVLSRHDGLISDQVMDLAFSRSGAVVATPAGLTFLTTSGAQSIYVFQGLVNNHVYSLATEPQSGRVIAGTLGGISLLEDGSVRENVTLKNSGLKRNWVTAVVKAPQPDAPDLWFVGTYGGSVMQMDAAGHVSAMDTDAPEAVISPNAMLVTPDHVFAGTLSDGLLVYNRASRHWSRITAGLPSRNVTAFAERGSELYVGTDNGVVHVAERNLP